jgi:hypothetical protein
MPQSSRGDKGAVATPGVVRVDPWLGQLPLIARTA